MTNLIRINGHEYPQPQRGLNLKITSNIHTSVNANGVTVGQKVGRDRQTLGNLQWAYLTASQWSSILKEFQGGRASVSYPDMVEGNWKTISVLPGDRTGTPCHIDRNTGLPLDYVNCQVELIDMGA